MKHFFALLAVLVLALSLVGYSQVPNKISYQGLLTTSSGTPIADGNYDLTFKLYTVASGGAAVWTETHSSTPVSKGTFNVILGSTTSLAGVNFNRQLYVGITKASDPEFSPRAALTSAPSSLAPWTLSDTNISYTGGNVEIGGTLILSAPGEGPGKALLATTVSSAKSNQSERIIDTVTNDTLYSLTADASGTTWKITGPGGAVMEKKAKENDKERENIHIGNDKLYSLKADTGGVELTLKGPTPDPGQPQFATTVSSAKSNQSDRIINTVTNDTVYSLKADASGVELKLSRGGGAGKAARASKLETSRSNSDRISQDLIRNTVTGDTVYSLKADASGVELTLTGPNGARSTVKTTKSNTFRMMDSSGNTTANISDSGAFFKGAIKSGNSLIVDGPNNRLLTTSGGMYLGRDPATGSFANVNVGIGTTTPTAKLHIGGTAGTDGIRFPDGTLQTTAAGSGSPGGANGAVQFNSSGSFGGDATKLFWDQQAARHRDEQPV